MKKSIFILDICIFGLSITALLIAFFKNLSNVNFLIGAGLISLMGVAQTRMAVITNLSKDNPKVKTMRRMNRLTVILAVALYFVPLIDNDFIVNIPTSFIFVVTIMLFTGNVSTKLPLNKYMGLRLPWTTTDEKTWKIANRLLGYITFPLVFIMLILYFITEQSELVLFIGLVIWVGIPTIYSFIKQNNEKYAKINFIIVILMFLVSAIMLFFLPEKINILHNGDTYYPIPSILGIWLVPVISLVLNFTFIKQKKLSSLNSIIMGLLLIGSTIYYITLI